MDKTKILIVDDEQSLLYTLKYILKEYEVITFSNSIDALESIKSGVKYDILLVDFRMPSSMDGKGFLTEVKKYLKSYKAILVTAFSDELLLEQGLNDDLFKRLIRKPVDFNVLLSMVKELILLLHKERVEKDFGSIIDKMVYGSGNNRSYFIYNSEPMRNVFEKAKLFARYNETVCIEGESGVGKDVVANYIHYASDRKDKPFIIINCSTIPEHLFESEFFGYKKGAFSGANYDKPGKFHLANEGTLFLDEIGDLPKQQQAKLLRAIEENKINPIGSTDTDIVNIRFICATNKDLKKLVENGEFREDLLYRLNSLYIKVPPLRERREDIPLLARYFLNDFINKEGSTIKIFSNDALEYLKTLDFYGNVRELKRLVNKLYIISTTDVICKEAIVNILSDNHINRINEEGKTLHDAMYNQTVPPEDIYRMYISVQLEKYNYIISDTANALGLDQGNFSRKLKSLGICVKDFKKLR